MARDYDVMDEHANRIAMKLVKQLEGERIDACIMALGRLLIGFVRENVARDEWEYVARVVMSNMFEHLDLPRQREGLKVTAH
jgi:hypothetical protein